jgi:hypothetical protein
LSFCNPGNRQLAIVTVAFVFFKVKSGNDGGGKGLNGWLNY